MKSTPAATNTNDATICLPGENAWELWKQSAGTWSIIQTAPVSEKGGPGSFKSATLFAFPISSAFAVPIRSASSDPELLPDIVDVQLEKQGLKPETPVGRLMDYRRVDSEEHNTLLLATVLNAQITDDFPRAAPQKFDLSPYLYYFPDDHLIIWKELGRLVFCVTRGDQPVYYHALSTTVLSEDTAQEIEHLLMPLYTQGMIHEIKGILLWTNEAEPGAAHALATTFGTRVRTEPHPKPSLPSEPSKLEPVSIAEGKIRAAKLKKLRNIVGACALAYLAIPAFFAYRYFTAKQANDRLAGEVAGLTRQYEWVKPTLERSRLMDAVVNWDKYPIEQLKQVFQPLYENLQMGVRVTSVEMERAFSEEHGEQAQIVIKGESQAQQQAIVYTQKIKAISSLQEFEWKPKVETAKDGKIPFSITGTTKKVVEPAS